MNTIKTKPSSDKPFALDSDSKALHVSARLFTVVVALGAFVLSFNALSYLAENAGILPQLSWVWALSVDGFIIINTIAAFSLQNKPRSRAYAWFTLSLFVLLSIFGNAWHAVLATTQATLPTAVAVIVTAIPPITLFLSIHLLILMVSPTREQKEDMNRTKKRQARLRTLEEKEIEKLEKDATIKRVRESEAARLIRDVQPLSSRDTATSSDSQTASQQVQHPTIINSPSSESPENIGGLSEEEVIETLTQILNDNEKFPSGKTVGEWLGKSERTGQNLVKKFREDNNLL